MIRVAGWCATGPLTWWEAAWTVPTSRWPHHPRSLRRMRRPPSRWVTDPWPTDHWATQAASGSAQRVEQVRYQVLGVLDAHREPDQVGGNFEQRACGGGVCHPARELDQRLHTTQ